VKLDELDLLEMLSRWFCWVLSIAIVCWVGLGAFMPSALAQTVNAIGDEVPTVQTADGVEADWNRISFSSLPRFESAGEIAADDVTEGNFDYTLSRSWQAGASPAEVLKIGDVGEAFGLGSLTLGQTVPFTNVAPDQLSLDNLQFLRSTTLSEFVQEVPGLGAVAVKQVKPLFDLVKAATLSNPIGKIGQTDQIWSEQPLAVLIQMPEIGNLPIGSLDLSQYSFTQIPGLDQLAIQNIAGANNLSLSAIPGLPNIPLSSLPFTPGKAMGYIAIHDVTYGGDHEHDESRQTPTKFSITGSDLVGFNYECHQARGCDYLELNSPAAFGFAGDSVKLHGARWIRGGKGKGEQMVKGGSGVLGALNGGMEPTGRHPFGKAFKVVLTDTNEATGTGKFSLYFRVCHHGTVDLGCTPYFIGPIPWFPTHEKGMVIVGLTNLPSPSGIEQPDTPSDVQQIIDQYDPNGGVGIGDGGGSLCGTGPGNIDWNALSSGITAIESSGHESSPGGLYGTVGERGCDRKGCYVPMGRYQLMSFRDDARAKIAQRPGGSAFLSQIDGGYVPSSSELLQYFPVADQDWVFKQSMSDSIKQLNAIGITGEAMVACLGEIWYHGECDHSSGHDYIGGPTVVEYGTRTLAGYRRAIQQGGKQCSVSAGGGNGKPGVSTGKMIYPLGDNAPITGQFGDDRGDHVHKGVDFAEPKGYPIKASDGGVVEEACMGCDPGGYGSYIVIKHDNGVETLYGHPSNINVKKGQQVSQGEVIGGVGAEGDSSGYHLHFEVIKNGVQTNPLPYLRK
jgi:hypothetical protein